MKINEKSKEMTETASFQPVTENFYSICSEMLQEILAHDPISSTYLGCHNYDHLLPDPSEKAMIKGQRIIDQTLEKLKNLNSEKLGV